MNKKRTIDKDKWIFFGEYGGMVFLNTRHYRQLGSYFFFPFPLTQHKNKTKKFFQAK